MPSIAVGVAFFVLFSNRYVNLFNTYTLLIIVGTIKYIPFANRASPELHAPALRRDRRGRHHSGHSVEQADDPHHHPHSKVLHHQRLSAAVHDLPARAEPVHAAVRSRGFILSTTLDYFDEMGLYAFSSGINLILIVTILICNTLVNKVTGASLDRGNRRLNHA